MDVDEIGKKGDAALRLTDLSGPSTQDGPLRPNNLTLRVTHLHHCRLTVTVSLYGYQPARPVLHT